MKCINCGKEITDGQKFCKYCGAPVNGPEIGEKPRKKGIRVGTFICILLFVAILAGAGLFIYQIVGGSTPTGNNGESTEAAAEATSGTTKNQITVEATTGTTKKQSAGEATTGTTEKQGEPEEPHVLPDSVPDEYFEHNGHTYAFYDASRYDFGSYQQVVEFCEAQGGHLAVINDRDENTFLFEILRDHYKKTAFFGYSDKNFEGSWEWADGSDRDYENWTTYGTWDLPDNGRGYGGDEDYAEFNYARDRSDIPNDGTWNDAPFMTNTKVFICEWEFDVVK